MPELSLPKDTTGEISILTGFSGCLALILGVVPVCLNMVLVDTNAQMPSQFITFAAVTAFCLLLMSAANDQLIKKQGRLAVRIAALVFGIAGPIFQLIPGLQMLAPALLALAISAFIMFWGLYLTTLNHKTLTLLLLLATVFAGFTGMLVYHLNTAYIVLFSCIMFAISWIISWLMPPQTIQSIYYTSKANSRERSTKGLGNRYTLVEVGLMLGSSTFLVRTVTLPPQTIALIMGGCVVVAGIAMMLTYVFFKETVGIFVKRFLTAVMAVCLLLYPLFGDIGGAICIYFLFVFVVFNIILIIDAISETARFNLVSPFWIIGLEGGILFVGLLVAQVIFSLVSYFWGLQFAPLAVVVIVVICCGLQITINNQSYPIFELTQPNFFTANEADSVNQAQKSEAQSKIHGANWRQKLEVITERYKLSPKQTDIMRDLLKGRDSLYIMERYQISKSTAKTHIYNLYKKLEVHSRQELLNLFETISLPQNPDSTPVKTQDKIEQLL